MSTIKSIRISYYLNYTIVVYAFILTISSYWMRSLTAILVLLWVIEGNYKEKFILVKNNRAIFYFLLFFIISMDRFFRNNK
jgi:hypothetical protein